ncbi:MAG: IclR family transcriptional regulator [Alphaproteobacteria bacterium]|nr:IclR family transcriptional regulator [Alphaproteobacteria bacterium]
MASRISGTVIKALDILDLFPGRDDGLSATQIAAATGINMSTVVRLCATLEGRRYLRRNGRGAYFIGPQIDQLARVMRTQFSLEDTLRPVLRALRDETGESASFYVRDGNARVCLYREDSKHAIRHVVAEGARLPLKEGVVGRVLLAYDGAKGAIYDEIRKDGVYAAAGREPFTASVSVPVFSKGGGLIGAIVVSGLADRFSARKRHAARKRLTEAGRDLTDLLPASAA